MKIKNILAGVALAAAVALTACGGPSSPADYGKEAAKLTNETLELMSNAFAADDEAKMAELQDRAKEIKEKADKLQAEFDEKYGDDPEALEEFSNAFTAALEEK